MSPTLTGEAERSPSTPDAQMVKRFFMEKGVLGDTRRSRQLDRYEAHYKCTQYAHLTHDWWGLTADQRETISPEILVPVGFMQPALGLDVRQKRPTAPYNLAKAVVDRLTGLLFSEVRKPDIIVENDEDTQGFLHAAMEQMRFWAKMREARAVGGSTGTVLVTAHLREGKFGLEVHNPKHCQIIWKDRRSLIPLAVFKCYRYPVEEDIVDERTGVLKGTKVVDYLYRRIITEEDDTVYKAVKLDGEGVEWEVESEAQHRLGFFPGVWIQNLPVLETEDGEPDCQGAWQILDTMDRLSSQMIKAVLLNLDPTLVLAAEERHVAAMGGSLKKGSDNALYVGQGGSANYLEIVGSGVDSGMKVWAQLKQNALDVVRCVLVDPQMLSGAAQSAKAIEYIYAPMLEKADDLRAQYGDLGVIPLLKIVERIARKYAGQTVRLPDGRVGAYRFDLPPRITAEVDEAGQVRRTVEHHKLGAGGYIQLSWGPYFSPTEDDKQKSLANITAAKGGGVLDNDNAVKQAAPLFNIRDPEAVIAKVRKEQAEMMGDMGALGGLTYGTDEDVLGPAAGNGGRP